LFLGLNVGGVGASISCLRSGRLFPFGGIGVMLGNLINAWTTWRYRLVEITPAFAAQRFMDTMSDGVLVLDQTVWCGW